MKLLLKILLLLFLPSFTKAQTLRQIDSLRFILQHAANDTVRMGVCSALGGWYDDISVDSGLYYCCLLYTSIISDKNGQIWISTYTNGLMKYNGNEIIKFENNPYDSNSIQGNEIAAIYEDNMKNIWISIGSNGSFELIRYNPVSKKIKKYGFHNIVGKEKTEKYVQIVDIKYIQNKLLFTIAFNAPLEKSILYFDPASDKLKVFAPDVYKRQVQRNALFSDELSLILSLADKERMAN